MLRRAFLLLVPGLAGCAGVTLRSGALDEAARVRELGLAFTPKGSGALSLALDVDNPTLWDAVITGVDYTLRLDGRRYAVGTRGVQETLASRERRALSLSFPLNSEPTGLNGAEARTWWVQVEGTVVLAFAGSTVRRMPFQAERFLRLPHFRPIHLEPE
ncbi:hypothetical protein [Melittangium boletus]|uniref:Lipoprotein n=1 Tax=Melittangium boletus DSM 14713 TaxID=1294270 RepID=A0A250IJD9_9BACT|nr:hypothetical protein [Melittangium boletus]ATB31323.1 hypothetical protein MEBOL_004785 [Melittangium boletus DSM 14713]